jgi:hypothetical protein
MSNNSRVLKRQQLYIWKNARRRLSYVRNCLVMGQNTPGKMYTGKRDANLHVPYGYNNLNKYGKIMEKKYLTQQQSRMFYSC